jgi:hypothetical protein
MILNKLKMEEPVNSKRLSSKHFILMAMARTQDIMFLEGNTFLSSNLMEVIKYGLIILN